MPATNERRNTPKLFRWPRETAPVLRGFLGKIATLKGGRRDEAFKKLMILAGLRKLGDAVTTEVKHMPILDDIMDHDVLGPAIRQGLQQGLQQGRKDGLQAGELIILRRQLNKRFGNLPPSIDERLSNLSTSELEDLSVRLFDAKTLDELFPR